MREEKGGRKALDQQGDFSGCTRFGFLTVIGPAKKSADGRRQLLCRCDCGTVKAIREKDLKAGKIVSCGCHRRAVFKHKGKDLTGKRFGKLVVIKPGEKRGKGCASTWVCKCDCGTIKEIRAGHLISGATKSCGCLHGENHGCSHDRLYNVWANMKSRCYNPKNTHYKSYGGRGITICDEWVDSFSTFKKWAMENGYNYDAQHGQCTIDRIDVNGNYEPSNCRWTDTIVQANNRRPRPKHAYGQKVEYGGMSFTSISELADHYDISVRKIYNRLYKKHMSLNAAIHDVLVKEGIEVSALASVMQ